MLEDGELGAKETFADNPTVEIVRFGWPEEVPKFGEVGLYELCWRRFPEEAILGIPDVASVGP